MKRAHQQHQRSYGFYFVFWVNAFIKLGLVICRCYSVNSVRFVCVCPEGMRMPIVSHLARSSSPKLVHTILLALGLIHHPSTHTLPPPLSLTISRKLSETNHHCHWILLLFTLHFLISWVAIHSCTLCSCFAVRCLIGVQSFIKTE